MKKALFVFALFVKAELTLASEANFYANKDLQFKYPGAFATQVQARSFHKELEDSVVQERNQLIRAILKMPNLYKDIKRFETLTLENQVKILRQLFSIECQVLKIVPPELIIDENSIPGYAYFDFDYQTGGAGKVILNLKKLKEAKNNSEFIVLLLHETRHSAQFQLTQRDTNNALSRGYGASFKAQKELMTANVKMSFCDFMLLLNEFEAFQFANYVYGAITNWQTPINDMGTLASQYDQHGSLRMDLLQVLTQDQANPIELFNRLEVQQYEVMYN